METKLQVLTSRLKVIKEKETTMIPYYDDVSKRRELEYCLQAIEYEKSRMKNFGYNYDDEYNEDYHQNLLSTS
tara:strand:- start:373 stop:591 length:219 start_codon:yes stop_codon:yes gene_type:complete